MGSGSLYESGGIWVAKVLLRDGRERRRKRATRNEAEAALRELKEHYYDELGYHYHVIKSVGVGARPRPRSGVTPRVRFQVLQRDGYRCVYCGATAQQTRLQVDHVVPVTKGGVDHPSNLATACEECNLGKADLLLEADA